MNTPSSLTRKGSFLNLVLSVVLGLSNFASADISSDLEKASAALLQPTKNAESMLIDGRWDEANRMILATFPEKSRTAVQSLALGNVLFQQDPQTAYALHKRAANELPNEPEAQLEWAMEQHRAGEYAAAVESYGKYLKAAPDFAPVQGLLAECLIRTGQTRQAVEAWNRSEKGRGSLEQFESWVCELHKRAVPHRDRAAFMAKARQGDIQAAERLIALDCDFEHDWWNRGPEEVHLKKDLDILRTTKFSDEKKLIEIQCAAECALIQATDEGNIGDVLRNRGFLLDDRNTLPGSGKMLAAMLAAALSAEVISKEDARDRWGPSILAKAKETGDAEMFNAAAHLYVGTARLVEIDQLGWGATGDARFAASLLVGLAGEGKLALDDPRLAKASKQFPENAQIARIVVMLTFKAGKPMQLALINAIKAEYSHFSVGGRLVARPSAAMLRSYFKELANSDLPPQ